ncbi:MAG: GntR family transcriptional regulator [Omnitrophica WOR_2 bacterium]
MQSKPFNDPPLYLRIYADLKKRIEDGEWAYGAMLPSENDLCEMYHIARGTVRQVLAELEKEGLVRRERGRGTFIARSILPKDAAGSNNHHISFIVPYVRDSFVSTILLGVESVARTSGYAVIFNHVENSLEKQELAIRSALQRGVAGIILYPVNSNDSSPLLVDLVKQQFPLVLVDRYIRGLYADYVTSDNFGGGLVATQHLLQLGHRRIAFLNWKEPATTIEQRKAGYRQALLEANLSPDPGLEWEVVGYPDVDQAAISEILSMTEPPTAIFAANDQLALAVQRVARAKKIAIPEELALVGFDNLDISSQLDTPLTTIAQSPFEIGKTAGDLIVCKIHKEKNCIQRSILPTHLIVRSSCGAFIESLETEKGG